MGKLGREIKILLGKGEHVLGNSNSVSPAYKTTYIPFIIPLVIFALALVLLGTLYYKFPQLQTHEYEVLRLPRSINETRALGSLLYRYKDDNLPIVLVGYVSTYIFLQSFAIPGSIFLSLIAGFLFPFYIALSLICFCSAVGATVCYLLFSLFGKRILSHPFFTTRLEKYSKLISEHRHHLLYYLIFLRITPIIPNWMINISSPVLDIPLGTFFVATFVGVAPPSCIAVQTGQTLNQLALTEEPSLRPSLPALFILFGVAFLSLAPVILQRPLARLFTPRPPPAPPTLPLRAGPTPPKPKAL